VRKAGVLSEDQLQEVKRLQAILDNEQEEEVLTAAALRWFGLMLSISTDPASMPRAKEMARALIDQAIEDAWPCMGDIVLWLSNLSRAGSAATVRTDAATELREITRYLHERGVSIAQFSASLSEQLH
jgi:hypothetical protein